MSGFVAPQSLRLEASAHLCSPTLIQTFARAIDVDCLSINFFATRNDLFGTGKNVVGWLVGCVPVKQYACEEIRSTTLMVASPQNHMIGWVCHNAFQSHS
jgi:hypothetical protein